MPREARCQASRSWSTPASRNVQVYEGDDLRDPAAGVVRHEIDAGQIERSTEVLDDLGELCQRVVRVRSGRRSSMQRKVHRYASPLALERRDHVAPQIPARSHAVDEERGPAGAGVDVADNAGVRLDELAPGVIFAWVHRHADIEAATCTSTSVLPPRPVPDEILREERPQTPAPDEEQRGVTSPVAR